MRERSFALPADSVPGSAMIPLLLLLLLLLPLPLPSDGLRPSNGLRVIGFCFRMLARCGGCTADSSGGCNT